MGRRAGEDRAHLGPVLERQNPRGAAAGEIYAGRCQTHILPAEKPFRCVTAVHFQLGGGGDRERLVEG